MKIFFASRIYYKNLDLSFNTNQNLLLISIAFTCGTTSLENFASTSTKVVDKNKIKNNKKNLVGIKTSKLWSSFAFTFECPCVASFRYLVKIVMLLKKDQQPFLKRIKGKC